MALTDILNDKSKYADTLEVDFGGEKVSLADLRSLDKSLQQSLSDKLTAADAREKAAAAKVAELTVLADKTATFLNSQQDPAQRQAVAPDEWDKLYDSDPSYAPVRRRLDALQKKLDDGFSTLDAQKKSLEQAAMIFANDRWDSQFRENRDRLKSDQYAQWRDPNKL